MSSVVDDLGVVKKVNLRNSGNQITNVVDTEHFFLCSCVKIVPYITSKGSTTSTREKFVVIQLFFISGIGPAASPW